MNTTTIIIIITTSGERDCNISSFHTRDQAMLLKYKTLDQFTAIIRTKFNYKINYTLKLQPYSISFYWR